MRSAFPVAVLRLFPMLGRAAAFALFLGTAGAQPASLPAAPRKVVVTIDDGPAVGTGRELEAFVLVADALREAFVAEQVPAIMFVNEQQLNVDGQRDARVAVLHRWLEAGLDLGNHGYAHLNLTNVGLAAFTDDIVKGEVVTRALLERRGKKLEWFRYPFLASGAGETAAAVETFLTNRGYRIAPVTVDYADYRYSPIYLRHVRAGAAQAAEEYLETVLTALDAAFARTEQRSREVLGYELPQLLLIHCNEMNALTLRRALARIRTRGYAFISMDDAMSDPAYRTPGLRPGALGGGGFLNSVASARRSVPDAGAR